MKKLNLLIGIVLLALISTLGYAQAPESFNYQAVLRDEDGSIIANELVLMQFTIRSTSEDGTIQYQEEQTLNTNEFGLVNHAVGTGNLVSGNFNDITWDDSPKFLQVELNAGSGLSNLGTQQLLSVPYAIHAETADAVTGGTNWSAAGNDVYNNNTGNVGIGTTSPENKLTIVASNATVELRDLEEATRLFMLPPSTEATGGVGTSGGDLQLFTEVGDRLTISNTTGNVGIATQTPLANLDVNGNFRVEGVANIFSTYSLPGDENGNAVLMAEFQGKGSFEPQVRYRSEEGSNSFDVGLNGSGGYVFESNDQPLMTVLPDGNVGIGTENPITQLDVQGSVALTTQNEERQIQMFTGSSEEAGIIRTFGPDETPNNYIGYYNGSPNDGVFVAFNEGGSQQAALFSDASGTGIFFTTGPTSNNSTITSNWLTFGGDSLIDSDRGSIFVTDENNFIQAGIHVDQFGNGVIYGDTKNFRMDHPSDASKEIWYACVEGPEAGAYDRGTATLVDGAVFVRYSAHYELVIDPSTVTVQLTPHSTETYGIAVTEKTEQGFWVKELMNGTGDFSFDWKVEGVRDGYQDYKVIRNKPDRPVDPRGEIALPIENNKTK